MTNPQQEPLRFLPIAGHTIRGDFDGGALSSDFGPLVMAMALRMLVFFYLYLVGWLGSTSQNRRWRTLRQVK